MPHKNRPIETNRLLAHEFKDAPFLTSQALSLGISRGELRACHRRRLITRLAYGVYIDTHSLKKWSSARKSLILKAMTAAMPQSYCAISHEAAAAALGLPCPRADGLWEYCEAAITGPSLCARRTRGVHIYERPVPGSIHVPGVATVVTNPARTAFDVASRRNLAEGLILADAVARRVLDTNDRQVLLDPAQKAKARAILLAEARQLHACFGFKQGLATLDLADPAAESPAESYSRAIIYQSELPDPRVGLALRVGGGRTYYGDLVWEGLRVVGEVDGRIKYASAADLRNEKTREDSLRRHGWSVVRWWGSEMIRDPDRVLARISKALGSASRRAA